MHVCVDGHGLAGLQALAGTTHATDEDVGTLEYSLGAEAVDEYFVRRQPEPLTL